MSRVALSVVLAIVASLVVISNQFELVHGASRSLEEYLDKPYDSIFLGGYLLVEEISKSATDIDELIGLFEQASDNLHDEIERQVESAVLDYLLELKQQETACDSGAIKIYIGLARHVFGDINILIGDKVDHHVGLFKYLKSVSENFPNCASNSAIKSLDLEYTKIADAVDHFDQLIRFNAKRGDNVDNDQELAKFAESLDELKGKFLSGKQIVPYRMHSLCSDIRQYPFRNFYNIYSLAKFVNRANLVETIPAKYAKILEYSRICMKYTN